MLRKTKKETSLLEGTLGCVRAEISRAIPAVIAGFVRLVVLQNEMLGVHAAGHTATVRHLLGAVTKRHRHLGMVHLEHEAVCVETFVNALRRDLEVNRGIAARCSKVEAPARVVVRNVDLGRHATLEHARNALPRLACKAQMLRVVDLSVRKGENLSSQKHAKASMHRGILVLTSGAALKTHWIGKSRGEKELASEMVFC